MQKEIAYENQGDPEISRLKEIAVLDVNAGLSLVGGSETIYKSTLKIIAKKIPTLTQTMTSCLENGDLGRFGIDVHSVKSSLAAVGAHALSRQALDLELESRAGNTAFCKKMFPIFAAELLELGEKLLPIFAPSGDAALQTGEEPQLQTSLAAIDRCLEEFDGDTALEMLSSLIGSDFGQQINELLVTLNEQIEMFEYENAKTSLDTLHKLILPP